ncbi:MAG: SPASM domain-containing protein [Anaerobutyricum sp.]
MFPKDDTLKNWLPTEEQLTAIADELVCLGLNEVASFQDLPIGEGVDTRNSCGVGNKIISIGADGSVYPCHMLHDPRLVMGNVYEEDLNQILTCELANECRNLHVDSIEVCQKCRHRYICGGGCRAKILLCSWEDYIT